MTGPDHYKEAERLLSLAFEEGVRRKEHRARLRAAKVHATLAHREADAFVHGLYQRLDPKLALGYKGCAIGCTLDAQELEITGHGRRPPGGWWREIERQFGIPEGVAELIDDNFERLGSPADGDFAVEALEAIAPGADLSGVTEAYWDATKEDDDSALLLRLLRGAPLASRLEVVTPNGQ